MMEHIETAHHAHKSINDILGGTVLGAMIQVVMGSVILLLETFTSGANMDLWASAAIKVGSLVVIYFGICNGRIAYKKNKIELKKLQDEQRAVSNP